MTGPEHYREAERLLDRDINEGDCWHEDALVHATLAVAAATANPLASGWQDVAT